MWLIRVGLPVFFPQQNARRHSKHARAQRRRNVVRIGEEGMADWLALRPLAAGKRPLEGPHAYAMFYWEAKAPNRRPSPVHLEWLEKRRRCGYEAQWFNAFQEADRPAVPASQGSATST